MYIHTHTNKIIYSGNESTNKLKEHSPYDPFVRPPIPYVFELQTSTTESPKSPEDASNWRPHGYPGHIKVQEPRRRITQITTLPLCIAQIIIKSEHRILEGSAAEAVACKCAAAGLSPGLSTACQTTHNVVPTSCKEKIAQLNAQLYFLLKKKTLS